jgi:predicted DsbA family dithiol-disulfide isomerase
MKNEISLVFDFLDPWGWVAERRLRLAMRRAEFTGTITYLPCRTYFSKKAVGQQYSDYQKRRFGSQAETHEKRVIAEASGLGIALEVLNVQKIPDPWLAMLALAKEHQHAPGLFDAFYGAIFRDGRDVGNSEVMSELLQQHSADFTARDLLRDGPLTGELLKREQLVAQWSHNLTPCIRIGDAIVSGAQPPSILEQLLMKPAPAPAIGSDGALSSAGSCVIRNIVERRAPIINLPTVP